MGPSEDRVLTTGLHTVCDIYCISCQDNVGWYYIRAFEASEKYKEGKYILEKAKLIKDDNSGEEWGILHADDSEFMCGGKCMYRDTG